MKIGPLGFCKLSEVTASNSSCANSCFTVSGGSSGSSGKGKTNFFFKRSCKATAVSATWSGGFFHIIIALDPSGTPVVANVFHEVFQCCSPTTLEIKTYGIVEIVCAAWACAWCISVERLASIFVMQRVRSFRLPWPTTTVQRNHFLSLAFTKAVPLHGVEAPKAIE